MKKMSRFETLRDAIIKAHKNVKLTEKLAKFDKPTWAFWQTLMLLATEVGDITEPMQAIYECKECNPPQALSIRL